MRGVPRAANAWRSETRKVEPVTDQRASRVVLPVARLPIGRLVRSGDFERVLKTRSQAQTSHFAVHHLPEPPSRHHIEPPNDKLSTGVAPNEALAVDDSAESGCGALTGLSVGRVWLGSVVPKRHARRAVTRSLLKREIRLAVAGSRSILPGGLWVVRLRAPFDKARFPSAASSALRDVVRTELEQLLSRVAVPSAVR